ncbi:hypothetical protein ES707_17821 [subsurface metagenome]
MTRILGVVSNFGFQMTPAPAVQAYCYIPRLKYGDWVDFLVDTGSSGTCLNGNNAMPLQAMVSPNTRSPCQGIGTCDFYYEDAVIVMVDDQHQPCGKNIRLGVQCISVSDIQANPRILTTPSLMGRDILCQCTFECRYNLGEVILTFP